jgi:hypothetical protein
MPRHRTVEERFWEKVDKNGPGGCWVWTRSKSKKGYGQLSGPHRGHKPFQTHRLSWEMHKGPIPAGLMVCHKCDNPACVRPSHLFIGTAKQNTQDMVNKGRVRRGERHAQAKLTDASVIEMRRMAAAGASRKELAEAFGVSEWNVKHVLVGDTWKHLEVPA